MNLECLASNTLCTPWRTCRTRYRQFGWLDRRGCRMARLQFSGVCSCMQHCEISAAHSRQRLEERLRLPHKIMTALWLLALRQVVTLAPCFGRGGGGYLGVFWLLRWWWVIVVVWWYWMIYSYYRYIISCSYILLLLLFHYCILLIMFPMLYQYYCTPMMATTDPC